MGQAGSKVYDDPKRPSRVLVPEPHAAFLQDMCNRAVHFNSICLAEALASLSDIFKLTHGSRDNFPDIDFFVKQRNSLAHGDYEKFEQNPENKKIFFENGTKLYQTYERIPKRYLQSYHATNNGLSVSYEGYLNAPLSTDISYNERKSRSLSDLSKAKLKIIDELVIPYFESSNVVAPKNEQVYLVALAIVGGVKAVSDNDFESLVKTTLKDVYKERTKSDIKPISGEFGPAILSNRLNNIMTQQLGRYIQK